MTLTFDTDTDSVQYLDQRSSSFQNFHCAESSVSSASDGRNSCSSLKEVPNMNKSSRNRPVLGEKKPANVPFSVLEFRCTASFHTIALLHCSQEKVHTF